MNLKFDTFNVNILSKEQFLYYISLYYFFSIGYALNIPILKKKIE